MEQEAVLQYLSQVMMWLYGFPYDWPTAFVEADKLISHGTL